jgi:SHAQKYF class myb-like DNA-binding protein
MVGRKWTNEEHIQFLRGLEKFGKGNWKAISREFVTSRTPTQVASHAQKYFLRLKKKKILPPGALRRSTFDVSSDSEESRTSETPVDVTEPSNEPPPTQLCDAFHVYTQCVLMTHRIGNYLINHPYMRRDVVRPQVVRGAIKNLDILL